MPHIDDDLCDILENVKFSQFQDREAHVESLVLADCDILLIETQQMVVEDADTAPLWFARELLTR